MTVFELPSEKYNVVRELFNEDYPSLAFVFGVIEKRMLGKIWVNNTDKPNVCLITTGGPYCFIAGKLSKEMFKHFLKLLIDKPLVKLVCPLAAYDGNFTLTDFGFEQTARLQYQYQDTRLITHVENNSRYKLMRVEDEKTFNSCNWFSFMSSLFSSPDAYLKTGISLILYDTTKNVVASEAHGIIADNVVEIGAVTHEDYRNQGLSTIVCNKLIQDCIKKGLNPIWTCDTNNIASRKVAERQGMEVKIEYIFHKLQK